MGKAIVRQFFATNLTPKQKLSIFCHILMKNDLFVQGVMDYYGSNRQWSTCSVEDFSLYYTTHYSNFCLKKAEDDSRVSKYHPKSKAAFAAQQ